MVIINLKLFIHNCRMNELSRKINNIGYDVLSCASSPSLPFSTMHETLIVRMIEEGACEYFEDLARDLFILKSILELEEKISMISHKDAGHIYEEIDEIHAMISLEKEEDVGVVNAIASESLPASSFTQSLDDLIKTAQSRTLVARMEGGESKENNNEDREGLAHVGTQQGNPAIRQSAILEKIKNDGSCRMKDILHSFPENSERTLRNDLQKLCDQEMIRRIGNGGPYTFYTSRP